jgi:hypothetical protein
MHPRINEIFEKVSQKYSNAERMDLLLRELHLLNTTRTEAWLVLHKGYGINEDLADKVIAESGLWDIEDYLSMMYQIALYLKDDFEKNNE